jgi:hypothetical protein
MCGHLNPCTESPLSGEDLLEVLGGASVTTPGAKCGKTRALSTDVFVLVSKGEVAIQVEHVLMIFLFDHGRNFAQYGSSRMGARTEVWCTSHQFASIPSVLALGRI